VREHCAACQSGQQHQSYVLYGKSRGRRLSIYVPADLVPLVRRMLANGRALQELLRQAAPRYVKAWKQQRTRPTI